MPKRHNQFQDFVAMLEEQLAPEGAEVLSSVLLTDSTGQQREIDVLIVMPLGHRTVTIGIECRDHGRKADVTWLEQLKTKFESLPIDKRVAVSRSGFTKGAQAKATAWHIQAMSLGQAFAVSWSARLQNLTALEVRGQNFEILSFSMEIEMPEGRMLNIPDRSPDGTFAATVENDNQPSLLSEVWLPNGTRLPIILDLLNRLIQRRDAHEAVWELDPDGMKQTLEVHVALPPGFAFRDTDGISYPLTEVKMVLKRLALRSKVDLSHGGYGNTAVAFGSGAIEGVSLTLALCQQRGGGIRGGARLRGADVMLQFDLSESLASPLPGVLRKHGGGVELALPVDEITDSMS
jgi:hypothetical protein